LGAIVGVVAIALGVATTASDLSARPDGSPRRHLTQAAPAVGRVESYAVASALVRRPGGTAGSVALRSFSVAGRPYLLVVDPDTLLTSLVSAEGVRTESWPAATLRARLSGTTYVRALEDGRRNEGALRDAGVTHLRRGQPGINLTVDLCPSRHPLDRRLFTTLLEQLERLERPVPVAVAVTGVWLRTHPADLDWLVGLVRSNRLAITWVNHSFNHFWDRSRPLASNFLLEPGTNMTEEVLATERALIEQGLVPSVFFRFPGLVSSRELVETVVSFGLVPVGSDAWLAKGEWPTDGSIVLVHGNGNEPLGVSRFIELLARERSAVRQHRWLLLDLRASLVNSERTPER
jgi:hypothetical protein